MKVLSVVGSESLDKGMEKLKDLKALVTYLNSREFEQEYLVEEVKEKITYWQRNELLPIEQKLSVVEILWLGLIEELEGFGFEVTTIKKIHSKLLGERVLLEGLLSTTILEKTLVDVLVHATPVFLAVTRGGDSHLLNDLKFLEHLRFNSSESYVSISINHSIKENVKQIYSAPVFEILSLTQEEKEVLRAVRENNFVSVKVIKKNGAISLLECEETKIAHSIKELEVIFKEGDYQKVEVNQANNKIVSANRIVKRKVNANNE